MIRIRPALGTASSALLLAPSSSSACPNIGATTMTNDRDWGPINIGDQTTIYEWEVWQSKRLRSPRIINRGGAVVIVVVVVAEEEKSRLLIQIPGQS